MEKDTSLERLTAAICPIVLDALRGLAAHPEDRDAAWEMEGNVLPSIMEAAAAAYAQALEEMDRELCASLPEGMHVHDIRTRMVATRLGDVSFRRRRCTDRAGNVDALPTPSWGSRPLQGSRRGWRRSSSGSPRRHPTSMQRMPPHTRARPPSRGMRSLSCNL